MQPKDNLTKELLQFASTITPDRLDALTEKGREALSKKILGFSKKIANDMEKIAAYFYITLLMILNNEDEECSQINERINKLISLFDLQQNDKIQNEKDLFLKLSLIWGFSQDKVIGCFTQFVLAGKTDREKGFRISFCNLVSGELYHRGGNFADCPITFPLLITKTAGVHQGKLCSGKANLLNLAKRIDDTISHSRQEHGNINDEKSNVPNITGILRFLKKNLEPTAQKAGEIKAEIKKLGNEPYGEGTLTKETNKLYHNAFAKESGNKSKSKQAWQRLLRLINLKSLSASNKLKQVGFGEDHQPIVQLQNERIILRNHSPHRVPTQSVIKASLLPDLVIQSEISIKDRERLANQFKSTASPSKKPYYATLSPIVMKELNLNDQIVRLIEKYLMDRRSNENEYVGIEFFQAPYKSKTTKLNAAEHLVTMIQTGTPEAFTEEENRALCNGHLKSLVTEIWKDLPKNIQQQFSDENQKLFNSPKKHFIFSH